MYSNQSVMIEPTEDQTSITDLYMDLPNHVESQPDFDNCEWSDQEKMS